MIISGIDWARITSVVENVNSAAITTVKVGLSTKNTPKNKRSLNETKNSSQYKQFINI